MIIDTAGMRKQGKDMKSVEKYSVLRALKAIERSDVVLVLSMQKKAFGNRIKKLLATPMMQEEQLLLS